MGSAKLALSSSGSASAVSSGAIDRIQEEIWSKEPRQLEAEAIVEDFHEDAFSSTNLIVDDDFKLKMDASLVIMILQNVLLQVSSGLFLA